MTTGAVHPLPHAAAAMGQGFTSVAWRPDDSSIVVSTGYAINADLDSWLLDVRHDTVRHLVAGQYAAEWSPDGATLVLTTSSDAAVWFDPIMPHDLRR